ncbi:MAG: M28 family peptidase [Alphaproteobacteria bacterium]|nr:M28 family peptidase [Alphaproteobacteria bacterium]
MKNFALTSALVLALAACGESQKAEEATAPYAMNTEALKGHITTLASDEFGGRAPGSPGEELTVQYLETAFRDAGLKPANGDSYTQAVPLVSIETQGAPEMHIKGTSGELKLQYRADHVVWTRREQNDSEVHESDMVFVGYGINAPERGWNDYEGLDVKGKTVVIMVNDPGFATQDPELFAGNTMTYYGRWDYKFDEAARQGAAAAIIIHDTKPAAYGWMTVDSSWTGPQFGLVREDKGTGFSEAEAWITNESAHKLFELAGLDLDALTVAAAKPGFKAVPMNLEFSSYFRSDVNHLNSRNVAGYVEGTEAPDELFIYMAHWDHIGTDPTQEGDGIYNGALDNATGTGGLIELARAYASGPAPKRSILFLAVTAEEQGLLGSAYYAEHPLFELGKTVGGINMDGLNFYGPTKDVTVIGLGNSELDDYLEQSAKGQDRVLTADQEPEKGYFYRSDHFELSKKGVPMLYPNSGYEHREKGRSYVDALMAEYLDKHYHSPSDEYRDDWDLTGAIEDLELYYGTGRLLVDSRKWPNWREGTEFKNTRDTQRAEVGK